ncbi:MAG: gliding motility-associated C-terminal domain-containing protein [Chitinophagaceae bacterium]|nr:gliding motility-associated C-terminal domain-containing protein [Chitinophagaceae bacterium]
MKKTIYLSLISKVINNSIKGFLFTLLILSSIIASAQTTVAFSTPGATTWVVPPCVTSVTVQVWSAGGGGGGSIAILRNSSDGEACSGAGGGGGGGYTSQTFAVTSGQVYNLVVGAGGTAGTAGAGTWNGGISTAPGAGGTGGTSSFMNFGINLVATGGIGGNGAGAYNNNNPPDVNVIGAPGAGGAGSGGTVFYNGGNGAAGYILWTGTDKSGGGGGAAGPGGAGGNAPAGNSYGIIDNNPGGVGNAPGGNGGNSRMNNLPSNTSKNGGNGNLIGAGGGGGLNHKEGYGAVSASGGAGARGEVRITYSSPVLPATPTISSVAPTCIAAGSSTISNYNAAYTYTFTPAGPTVGAGGVISGMVIGTSYTVTANDGSCNSSASAAFSNAAMLPVPPIPTISSTAPTCGVNGSSTISNYNAAYTYVFSPVGPTVGAGGVISGMVVGTNYQVYASNGSCNSTNSVDFSNLPMLPIPPTPTISSTAPTCSAAGSSTVSNYNAAYTYTFTPAGPTVGAGGVISGMVVGTSYTVRANNGTCNSLASAAFNNAAMLPVPPIPTISSTAPTCGVNGSSTISNYNAGLTYVFSPAGPTVGAGGVISGMVVGTNYQVSASNGSCSSSASVVFSNLPMLPIPPTPTISSTAPTCSAAGSSTVSNYNAAYTYNFTPAGPTVGAGGVISGMVVGTSYNVIANNGSCNSTASASFSNAATLTTPTIPTLSFTAPTCSAAGSSTVSNYNAALTYIFSPAGPTVGAGGVISGMIVGTNYQVIASNGSCSSSASIDFSNAAMLPTPPTPTISSVAPTCSAAGSSTVSNYNAAYTYTFTPAGPTVGTGGVISGMVVGTSYTVIANNGSCNSSVSAAFNNAAILPSPAVTASSASICENGVITLTPTTGGTWISNNTSVATVTAGGTVTIVGNGTVDFTFTATNTCTATTPSVLVNANDDATFSYSSNTHCLTGTDPVATTSGTSGGTFTITAPGVINATTGEIDLSASGLGTFTVYYNTASTGSPCPAIDSTIINITSAPSANFSYNVAQACQDATTPILSFGAGASAGVFSSSPSGLTLNTSNGAINLSTSTPGVYTVYNTIAASGGCAAALDSTTIEILQIDDATFNYTTGGTYCLTGVDPLATVTGTTGGTFTITAPGVINTTTGEIDLSASGIGTFTVYYNTPSSNACPQVDSTTVNITDAPTAGFSYNVAQSCQDAINPVLTMDGGATIGNYSSSPSGLTLNTTTGAITLSTSTSGVYTVYNTVAAAGGCAQVIDSTTIEVLQIDDATFNYTTGGTYCLTGTDPVATVSGTTGGTFTITAPGAINATTGEIDLDASGLGTFTVYYNTPSSNACPQVDSTTINIVNAPGASFTYSTPFCEGSSNPLPTFVGNNFAGIFSSSYNGTDSVIFVSTSTGEINLSSTVAGTYMIYNNLAASGGCASALDSFMITINPIITTPQSAAICQGDSILLGGTYQTNAGVYNDVLTGSLGCDSIVETTLTINPIITTPQSAAICQGDSILLGGTYQTIAGVYTDVLTGSLGCDSIIETTLTINPIITTQLNAAICQGDSILLGGAYQTIAGVYTDVLTGSLGCDSIIETTLTIYPLLSIAPNAVAPICYGDNLTLTATSSGNGTITWYSDAAGTTVIGTGSPFNATSQVSTIGNYTFYVREEGTCSSALVSVNVVVGGVFASIGATPTSGFMPLNVIFTNNSSTGSTVNYTWTFGDGTANSNQSAPNHTYTSIGNYTAVLIVTDGVCFDTATVIIEVIGQSSILIPNVFTPNSDGSNDVFTVAGTNLESVEGVIFNRWGQQLFSWDRVKGYWDGRTLAGEECPDGTYFYIIKAKGNDGAEYVKNGAFSLIR